MKRRHRTLVAIVLTASVALFSQTLSAPSSSRHGRSRVESEAVRLAADVRAEAGLKESRQETELLEESREAGLLTDWHLEGRFGRGGHEEFARAFAPEQEAAAPRNQAEHFELVFPEGKFALPSAISSIKGVFYATSTTYLSGSGQWNVYLESGTDAAVFVDGRRVLESGPKSAGTQRGTIHAESGYHSVMVKFTAQAAPFRVAILPPNSGSRRKNNTPFLQAAPATEDMMAKQTGEAPMASQS